jgi:hypothetical protein
MAKFLQLALRNTNGLSQHMEELKTFISIHSIDIMLISEIHFTEQSYLKLPNYTAYHSNHPAGIASGGTAIRLKKLHEASPSSYSQDFIQATSVLVEDSIGQLRLLIFHHGT